MNKDKSFESFKKGDLEAFSNIYKSYYNKLFRYGLIFSADTTLVEDVIQEFFIKVLNDSKRLDHVLNFEIYLFKSIKQNILSEKNKNNRRGVIRKLTINPKAHIDSREKKIMEEESVTYKKEWLSNQIASLPQYLKEIIYLRYYEGFSYEQITQVTSLSGQVARNYVSKAIQKIRSNVEENEMFLFLSFFG